MSSIFNAEMIALAAEVTPTTIITTTVALIEESRTAPESVEVVSRVIEEEEGRTAAVDRGEDEAIENEEGKKQDRKRCLNIIIIIIL